MKLGGDRDPSAH